MPNQPSQSQFTQEELKVLFLCLVDANNTVSRSTLLSSSGIGRTQQAVYSHLLRKIVGYLSQEEMGGMRPDYQRILDEGSREESKENQTPEPPKPTPNNSDSGPRA